MSANVCDSNVPIIKKGMNLLWSWGIEKLSRSQCNVIMKCTEFF